MNIERTHQTEEVARRVGAAQGTGGAGGEGMTNEKQDESEI